MPRMRHGFEPRRGYAAHEADPRVDFTAVIQEK